MEAWFACTLDFVASFVNFEKDTTMDVEISFAK
jgi:hypothetical protein